MREGRLFIWFYCIVICHSMLLSLSAQPENTKVFNKIWDKPIDAIRQYQQKGQYEKAISAADSLLIMVKNDSTKAVILTIKGTTYRALEKWEKALYYQNEALLLREGIFGKKSLFVGNSYVNVGNCYLFMKNYTKALEAYQNAKYIYAQNKNETSESLIDLYNGLSYCYQGLGDFSSARKYCSKSISLAEADNNLPIPTYYWSLGKLFFQQNLLDSATFIYLKILNFKSLSPTIEINTHLALAKCSIKMEAYRDAAVHLKKAKNLFNKEKKKLAANEPDLAQTYAEYYWQSGDLELAIGYFKEAEQLYTLPTQKINMLINIGDIQRFQGKTDEAMETFGKAMGTARRIEEVSLKNKTLGVLFCKMGVCLLNDKNKIDFAISYFKQGETLLKQSNALEEKMQSWLQLGKAFLKKGDYGEAQIYFNQVLERTNDASLQCEVYRQLGMIQEKQKKYQVALDHYEKAERILDQPAFSYQKLLLALNFAQIYQKMALPTQDDQYWKQCFLHATRGIEILEILKGNMLEAESKLQFQNTFFKIYNLAIIAAFELAKKDITYKVTTFEYAERYKNNFLKKLLPFSNNKNQEWMSKMTQLEKKLIYYKRQQFLLEQDPLYDKSEWIAIQQNTNDLIQRKDNLLDSLQERHPQLYAQLQQEKDLSLASIQEQLQPNQSLLSFHWTEERILAFLIKKDIFEIYPIPNAPSIRQNIIELNLLYRNYNSKAPPKKLRADYERLLDLSFELYQCLFNPIDSSLDNHLIIIPDAWLCYLPFEALLMQPIKDAVYHFKNHHFLVNHHTVSYSYSTPFFFSPSLKPEKKKDGVLAIAPSFQDNPLQLNQLSHNKMEVQKIVQLLGGKMLLEKKATKTAFQNLASQYPVIHLSTHGLIDNQNPSYSFLAFTDDEHNWAKDSSLLFVNEIPLLPLSAELVVLSACQTANGVISRGEGLMSISRAFLQAGAQTLIASLWDADDHQSAILMEKYYEHLLSGKSKATALQKAKQDLLKSPNAHPYYWAGFVCIGSDGTVNQHGKKNKYSYVLFLSSLLLLFFLARRFRRA